MRLRWFLLGIALVGASGLWLTQALAGAKVYVGRPCAEADRPSLDLVDHTVFDRLLQKYVDDSGMVAYAKWHKSPGDLRAVDTYLARLGCVNLTKAASKSAKLAYWINAYNALTLKGILREYPTKSIRNHTARVGYNIWRDLLLWVDGKHYSLDDIEHRVLRKMGEPRIHFAVNCASIGCPPLVKRAYTAKNLERMLDGNARRFFSDSRNLRIDPDSRTVHISSLIRWYGSDFASSPLAQVRALRRYFPNPDELAWLDRAFSVRYLSYDWNLNEVATATRR